MKAELRVYISSAWRRLGASSSPRVLVPPMVVPSRYHCSDTNGLYDDTRCASVPAATVSPSFMAVEIRGIIFCGSGPTSLSLPPPPCQMPASPPPPQPHAFI